MVSKSYICGESKLFVEGRINGYIFGLGENAGRGELLRERLVDESRLGDGRVQKRLGRGVDILELAIGLHALARPNSAKNAPDRIAQNLNIPIQVNPSRRTILKIKFSWPPK